MTPEDSGALRGRVLRDAVQSFPVPEREQRRPLCPSSWRQEWAAAGCRGANVCFCEDRKDYLPVAPTSCSMFPKRHLENALQTDAWSCHGRLWVGWAEAPGTGGGWHTLAFRLHPHYTHPTLFPPCQAPRPCITHSQHTLRRGIPEPDPAGTSGRQPVRGLRRLHSLGAAGGAFWQPARQ